MAEDHIDDGTAECLDTVLKGMGIHPLIGEDALIGVVLTKRSDPYQTEIVAGRFGANQSM